MVDSQGFCLGVLVTEANGAERLGALVVLEEAKEKLRNLKRLWVDAGYSGENFRRSVQAVCGKEVEVEVIRRQSVGFEVLPKRWIVERTFGWFNRFRRLSKDYELHSETSEAMIYSILLNVMLRRLTA